MHHAIAPPRAPPPVAVVAHGRAPTGSSAPLLCARTRSLRLGGTRNVSHACRSCVVYVSISTFFFFFAYTRNLRFFLLRQRRDKSDLYHTVFSRVSDFFFLETIPIHFFDSKQVHSYSCIAVTGRERLVILSVEMLACKKHTSTRTTFTSTKRTAIEI
jgi:hypothetical protein